MKRFFFFLVANLVSFFAVAQKPTNIELRGEKLFADLHAKLAANPQKDKVRAKWLVALSEAHYRNGANEDSIVFYAENAKALSRTLKFDSVFNEACNYQCKIYAAKKKMDKAHKLLPEVAPDQQARLWIVIGEGYFFRPGQIKSNLDSGYLSFSQALKISKAIGSEKWRHESLMALGKYYFGTGETEKAKNSFLEIIRDRERKGDSAGMAHAWASIGKYMPDTDSTYDEQIAAHEKGMKIFHALKDTNNERSVLEDIAAINIYHANFVVAKEQFLRAIEMRKSVNNPRLFKDYYCLSWIAHSMGDLDEALKYAMLTEENAKLNSITRDIDFNVLLGQLYYDNGQLEESLQQFLSIKKGGERVIYHITRRAIELYIRLGKINEASAYLQQFEKNNPSSVLPSDKESLAAAKGDLYSALKQPALAEKYYLEMIRMDDQAQQYKSKEVLPYNPAFYMAGPEAYYKIADFYNSQNRISEAVPYLTRALKVSSFSANKFYTSNLMRKIWWLKFKVDSASGNHLAAIQSYERYTALNDSIFTAGKARQFQQLQVQYETAQKENDIKARDKQIKVLTQNDLLRQANLKQATLIRNATIAGILVLLILTALLYRQYLQKQKANKLITQKSADLQHLLTEKEWLLKEVHHRVKNNLHTIICLLESQAVYLEDDALKAIEKSQHRVYAMSLIHQKLYQAEDVKTVEMANYLPEFIQYLKQSFGITSDIIFNLDIDPLELDVSHAVPIALVINEAVTNSIKYAFPENKRGTINISMHRSGKDVRLEIKDDGIGIDQDMKKTTFNSLGVELMKGLSEDINGTIRFVNDHGTTIILEFKNELLSGEKTYVQLPEGAATLS